MILTTERLVLRPWTEADAESLYKYAKDSDVGTPAGWPAHKSVEESLEIIKTVFTGKECYAILKEYRKSWDLSIIIPAMKFRSHC